MNTQELARELGHPGAQELLRSGSMARLAYNGSDGLPRVIPIGFYLERRTHCRLHGTDLPKGSGAFVTPECGSDD
jgi:nitroimidazol reductase NimA-like FMN-containing flavoprotein (pyridoxamine 5'-phosphate oxidase superfamily)